MANIKQVSSIQQSLNNISRFDWSSYERGIQQSLNNISRFDWSSYERGIQRSLNNISRFDWSSYKQTLLASINQIDIENLATTFNRLNNFPIQEISEVLEEYESKNNGSYTSSTSEIEADITVNETRNFSYEEIVKIVDSRLASVNNEKTGFKKFFQDLILSYGQDLVKKFISFIILPFFFMAVGLIIDNHMLIVDTIQDALSNGVYVIGYAHAKKVIKEEGLSRYENIQLIGLIRVPSYIRINPNKHSAPIHPEKVPLDTVVSIVERRENWIKVEINLNDVSLEGWIEKSKIIRFKRKK